MDLRKKLDVTYKHLGQWKAIMFGGKGFYEFAFSSLEDMCMVLAVGTWNLSLGIIRVFAWTRDFVPFSMKLTKTQCWIRILVLPLEYWQSKAIFAIFSVARDIDTPLSLDDYTKNKS